MVIRRHILRALCAIVVFALAVPSARAERRALRRAVSNAVHDSRSNLLQRMFAPGGAAWRGSDSARCSSRRVTIQPAPVWRSSSNGTIYDRFSYDSFPGRYAVVAVRPEAVSALATSSNYANVYAPAANRVPGMPGPSDPAPGAALASGGYPRLGAVGLTQTNIGGSPSISEALWQIGRQRRAEPASVPAGDAARRVGPDTALWTGAPREIAPDAAADAPSTPPEMRPELPPAAAPRVPQARHIDLALRSGAKAFQRGEHTAARDAYLQAMMLGCADSRARIGLTLADFAAGNYREAARAAAAELISAPHMDRSALDLRRAYGRPEEFDAHLATLRLAADAGSDRDLLLLLGYVQFFSGDRQGGRAAWARCLSAGGLDADTAAAIRALSK